MAMIVAISTFKDYFAGVVTYCYKYFVFFFSTLYLLNVVHEVCMEGSS